MRKGKGGVDEREHYYTDGAFRPGTGMDMKDMIVLNEIIDQAGRGSKASELVGKFSSS